MTENSATMRTQVTILRGDIYYANLDPAVGSEQSGIRPILIISNDVGNHFSLTVIAAPLTAKNDKPHMPTHVPVSKKCGLERKSYVLLEQIRVLDHSRLRDYAGHLADEDMIRVNKALAVSVGLVDTQ